MLEVIKRYKKGISEVCVMVVAVLAFVIIFGADIIDPQNIEMYKSTGFLANDRNQHYSGWAAYRQSAWQFPIGLFNTLTYPDNVSIIFTDSIPLLAVIFKLLSPLLPEQFQYFGIWEMMCFALVALIAYRIIYKATDHILYSALGSMLFIIAPIMIHRATVHEALMAHWIVLYALETLFYIRDYIDTKKIYTRTVLLGFFASTIHMYFLLLSGIVMIGICISVWIMKKNLKIPVCLMMIYLAIAVFFVWILGGFSSSGVTTTDVNVLGIYSANLNTFINPLGKSVLLQDKPLYSIGQADGTGYLGVGCILMLLIAVSVYLNRREDFVLQKWQKISIGIVALLSFGVAISPIISINNIKLFEFHLPRIIEEVWSNFRCYGRLVWIDVWLFMFAAIVIVGRTFQKRLAFVILSVVVLVQCYDLHDCFAEYYDMCHDVEPVIDISEYDEIKVLEQDSNAKNIIIWKSYLEDENYNSLVPIYIWAVEHGMTVNYFYLARDDAQLYELRTEKALKDKRETDIFVFEIADEPLCIQEGLYYKIVGDYIFARTCPW